MKKNKAFTLIELIAVLVILAIISLIVAPLLLNIIRRVKDVANKRSVDGYGRAVEYAMADYQLKHLAYPDTFDKLDIEYKGNKVECKTSRINPDYSIYLSECKVNGKLVKNDKEFDGYYHYGILKMTNQEYVDTYGKNLEDALKKYYDEHNEYPSDYTTLELPPLDKEVACDVQINCDGTVNLTSCKVDNEDVVDENNEVYVYGEKLLATTCLLLKTNSKSITTYTDGDTHEMYTFDHEATEQTPALTDYRYIGNVPYNYVTFNNELWRIIGIFTVEDENGNTEEKIKIVRNTYLDNMMWNSGEYTGNWLTSTLNTYLNTDYYNSLSSDTKSMIAKTRYYIARISNGGGAEEYYSNERNTTTDNWSGNIALIYPSDNYYTYALGVDDTCYTIEYWSGCNDSSGKGNGWIYNLDKGAIKWTISWTSHANHAVWQIKNGSLYGERVNVNAMVNPTLYLKSNVKIKSGDGTIDNPYEFEL